MKKLSMAVFGMLLLNFPQAAAQVPYIEEVRALGSVAGQGLACGASKYDAFELLARAILISKAPSNSIQAQGIYAYNEEKANAYISKQYDGFFECDKINRRFDNQAIFQAVLYADGTIKMPDGTIVTPREPYDASQIYQKNAKIRDDLQAIYQGSGNAEVKELKIKSTGSDTDIQTVYKPQENAEDNSLPSVAAPLPSAPDVSPAAADSGGVRHIKRRK